MLKRFLPSKNEFFVLFQSIVANLILSAAEFQKLLSDLDNQQPHVNAIAAYEIEGDRLTRKIFKLLHKTFITPFDRHDIHQLTSKLDDILDLINGCAQRFPLYDLKELPEQIIQLSILTVVCVEHLKIAIDRLNSLQKSQKIIKACEDIDTVENEAHILLLSGEKKLFLEESDFKHFHKLKEIYSSTKNMINKSQDVANIIKGIVLEYS
ncbi:MAG: DUF47 family protein [Gammaproteobacteria bacterium]|nr:DUF47 family protein [Gammaproteobacteria bacterium]